MACRLLRLHVSWWAGWRCAAAACGPTRGPSFATRSPRSRRGARATSCDRWRSCCSPLASLQARATNQTEHALLVR
eukprot:5657385-Prymnesium_polylepis.1